jgi:hypothetical protein
VFGLWAVPVGAFVAQWTGQWIIRSPVCNMVWQYGMSRGAGPGYGEDRVIQGQITQSQLKREIYYNEFRYNESQLCS